MALKVSPEGELLEAISIPKLLVDTGYSGHLYLSTLDRVPTVVGDSMHLNDVEEFPGHLEPGYFGPGDVVVSLRNTSTVLVFNLESRKIKYLSTGRVLRQHDPDFFDGNRLSVFDNNTVADSLAASSRIVLLSAPDDRVEVVFPTTRESFFTAAQGKHQWLDNGHLLITESQAGRALEVDVEGEVIWEYVNYLDGGIVGLLLEATRLPAAFDSDTFKRLARRCL